MNLPENARLAYTVTGDASYARSLSQAERDTIEISADTRDADGNHTGALWSFTVYERHDLGSEPCLQMQMFSDSFPAFRQVPELFAALGEWEPPETLAGLQTVLDGLGAVDVTDRGPVAACSDAGRELAELIDPWLSSRLDLDHVLAALDANPDLLARFAVEAAQRRRQ